jgi:hypothetical protein
MTYKFHPLPEFLVDTKVKYLPQTVRHLQDPPNAKKSLEELKE